MKTKQSSKVSKATAPVVTKKKTCSVCYGNRKHMAALECGHEFCKKCTKTWSKRETSCPLCRQPFSSYTYKGTVTKVKQSSQKTDFPFHLIVAATTNFLHSARFRNKVRNDVLEEKPGATLLIQVIHHSLLVLDEEQYREEFNYEMLRTSILCAESIMGIVHT